MTTENLNLEFYPQVNAFVHLFFEKRETFQQPHFFCLFVFMFCFENGVPLCILSGWPGTCYVDRADFELTACFCADADIKGVHHQPNSTISFCALQTHINKYLNLTLNIQFSYVTNRPCSSVSQSSMSSPNPPQFVPLCIPQEGSTLPNRPPSLRQPRATALAPLGRPPLSP